MQAEILNLFPTAVVRHRVDVKPFLSWAKSQPMHHTGSHSYSNSTHVLDTNPELEQIIEAAATDYAEKILAITGSQRVQTSWINHSSARDFTHEHIHSNAAIALCLYLELPGDQDRIRFHKNEARSWGVYNLMFDTDPQQQAQSPWAQTTIEIPVRSGDLLIWPAWLLHSVPPTEQDQDRWTLAANTMPKNGWGSRLHEYRVR